MTHVQKALPGSDARERMSPEGVVASSLAPGTIVVELQNQVAMVLLAVNRASVELKQSWCGGMASKGATMESLPPVGVEILAKSRCSSVRKWREMAGTRARYGG